MFVSVEKMFIFQSVKKNKDELMKMEWGFIFERYQSHQSMHKRDENEIVEPQSISPTFLQVSHFSLLSFLVPSPYRQSFAIKDVWQ